MGDIKDSSPNGEFYIVTNSQRVRSRSNSPLTKMSRMDKNKNNGTAAGTSTSNRFELLSDDDASESTDGISQRLRTLRNKPKRDIPGGKPNANISDTNTNAQVPVEKKFKIPPIVIKSLKYTDTVALLKELVISVYKIKLMSIGIKIDNLSSADYDTLQKHLIDKNHEFYTFENPETKFTKIVLTGLPLFDVNYVKEGLESENIICEDVKLINPKLPRSSGQALYVLYFKNNSVNLNHLRLKRSVLNVIVKWNFYKAKKGPTQCNNCLMFGHGGRNCHLKPRCRHCGDNHEAESCATFNSSIELASTVTFIPKCCNCGGNHPGNHSECIKRDEFINIKKHISVKNNYTKTDPPARSAYVNNPSDYPAISKARGFVPVTQRSLHQSFSQPSTSGAHANLFKETSVNSSANDLFTADELIEFTNSLLYSLKECKNKIEQCQVVSALVIKFVYNGIN